jgi:heme exporter protein C
MRRGAVGHLCGPEGRLRLNDWRKEGLTIDSYRLEGEQGIRGWLLFRFAAPQAFFPLAGRMAPWFAALAALLAVAGLYISFFVAPTDAQQGEAYRIIFIHVAAAWMSMFLYVVMACWAALGLVLNTRLSGMMASAVAPTGAMFTFVALWSGALWGKPTWGTWWVWDARLTSELILLFLYFGFIALTNAIDDPRRADRAGAVLAIVGVINVPIIYFSVKWWNTLHQGASVSLTRAPSMAATMLTGMLLMALAAWMYSIAVTLWRVRSIILERERDAEWVRGLRGVE